MSLEIIEADRKCFNCKNYGLCYIRVGLSDIVNGCRMLKDANPPINAKDSTNTVIFLDVYTILANSCRAYNKAEDKQ
jgi:hypothetical protein